MPHYHDSNLIVFCPIGHPDAGLVLTPQTPKNTLSVCLDMAAVTPPLYEIYLCLPDTTARVITMLGDAQSITLVLEETVNVVSLRMLFKFLQMACWDDSMNLVFFPAQGRNGVPLCDILRGDETGPPWVGMLLMGWMARLAFPIFGEMCGTGNRLSAILMKKSLKLSSPVAGNEPGVRSTCTTRFPQKPRCSGISKFPDELLVDVFQALVDLEFDVAIEDINEDSPNGEGWATVTHVCRRWRNVALRAHQLWSYVTFVLPIACLPDELVVSIFVSLNNGPARKLMDIRDIRLPSLAPHLPERSLSPNVGCIRHGGVLELTQGVHPAIRDFATSVKDMV
ncbi:hypothetical protein JAAARDRAFT_49212 [Jaapia argillacea MUCL 33604]|uniref:F-box domain-containing protein n=1 Tax=Jaapia argillacea MUCL 33604 TaxID=933084 RepID=A0A067PIH9_9AGAM|nr:hypothetical protein JAAARDRAFT_49212 [Jaapia argillacea MUCL 33604]